jgi:hypothetical protein
MGDTFGPKGFSSGSNLHVSSSKYPIELLIIDMVRAFDLAIEPGSPRFNVDVLNA